jgi:hypothetical protein
MRLVLVFALAAFAAGPALAAKDTSAPALPVQRIAPQDTGRCEADLVLTDIRLRQATERLTATARAPMARRCGVFRDHVLVMRRATDVFRRCTPGRHGHENVAHMRASIVDWNEIIARNCR